MKNLISRKGTSKRSSRRLPAARRSRSHPCPLDSAGATRRDLLSETDPAEKPGYHGSIDPPSPPPESVPAGQWPTTMRPPPGLSELPLTSAG